MAAHKDEENTKSDQAANAGTMHEVNTPEYKLQIVVADDEMSTKISITPQQRKQDLISAEELLALLNKHGVVDGIDLSALQLLSEKACAGKEQLNYKVAQTTPPQPGADSWLEPLIKNTKNSGLNFEEDENGRVDLYTLNLVSSVSANQQIAIMHPPELGAASSTVTGKVLPPLLGNTSDVRLGAGVRIEDNGTSFISEIEGRVEFIDNILSVSEDYIVHGDVDLEIGNITFDGYAKIRGDVLDQFDIYAKKGITVAGSVGSCHLITDGDVTIGSMSGRGEGLIRCAGNLKANYLNGVTVECMGSVTVTNEIRNSIIKSADIIMIKNGAISGGECIALNGIEAKNVGATAEIPTLLCSGIYFPDTDRLQKLKTQKKSINIQQQFIQHCLGPLQQSAQNEKNSSPGTKKRLEILLERLTLLKTMRQEVKQQLSNFAFIDCTSNAKINIHNLLKEKVTISLDSVTEELKFEHYGPLSVVADNNKGILRFCDMTPLDISAQDIVWEDEEPDETQDEDHPTTKT
jgi:hypothetical protein